MTLVLICECGARVRAPGAVPGRVGRCPTCGARLRVPDVSPENPRAARPDAVGYGLAPAAPEPTIAASPPRAPVGNGARPAKVTPTDRRTGQRGAKARNRDREDRAVDGGGLIPTPRRVESSLRESLLYPLWDAPGLVLIAFVAPASVVFSVFSIGLRDYVTSDDEVMVTGSLLMIFPMLCLLMLTFGFVSLFLADVFETSSEGETRHPRLPAWDFYEIFSGLFRVLGACGFGLVLGVALALAYGAASGALSAPEVGLFGRLVMAALVGAGAAFWPVPLVAVLLHQDIRAANPVTVLAAWGRTGGASIRIGLLFGITGAVTLVLAELLFVLPTLGTLPTMLGIALYWVLFWYAALVLARRLGLFARRQAKALGWFPERLRWGA